MKRVRKIVWKDTVDGYLKRNDEKTVIDRVNEEAAEENILSERELEQIHEEMLNEFYKKQYEEEMAEKENKDYAYIFIAEHLLDAAYKALDKGNLEESIAIGEVYNQWVKICVKAGVL